MRVLVPNPGQNIHCHQQNSSVSKYLCLYSLTPHHPPTSKQLRRRQHVLLLQHDSAQTVSNVQQASSAAERGPNHRAYLSALDAFLNLPGVRVLGELDVVLVLVAAQDNCRLPRVHACDASLHIYSNLVDWHSV